MKEIEKAGNREKNGIRLMIGLRWRKEKFWFEGPEEKVVEKFYLM